MANKKEGEGRILETIKNVFSSILINNLKTRAKEVMEHFIREAQHIIYQTEKKALDNLMAAAIMLLGTIILIFGIMFFLTDFLGIPKYLVYIIAGIILILFAIALKCGIDKTKYYDFGGEQKNG